MEVWVGGRGGAVLGAVGACKHAISRKERGRLTSLELYEVGLLELVAGDGVCAVFGDVFCDEPALVDMARLDGDDGVLGGLARDCAEDHVGDDAAALRCFVSRHSLVVACLLALLHYPMSEKQQRLVLSIIDFLNQSINDGTIKADDKESLEVASTPPQSCLIQLLSNLHPVQCIGEAFGVDPSDQEQVEKLSVKPTTLQSIFDVYMKTREKVGSRTQPADTPASKTPTAEDKAKAEKLKQEGNSLMSSKKYDEAIEMYNKAIALDSSNPVFYSNRAAAYSSKGDHLAAIGDANAAIKVDASFSKAYHRLG
jgi:hypothetical protein